MPEYRFIRELSEDEFGNREHMDRPPPGQDQIGPLFLGGCHGVRLLTRGHEDPHICPQFLTEDDGHWFVGSNGSFSSFWVPGVIALWTEVLAWLEENADPDVGNGMQFGWKVRKAKPDVGG